MLDPSGPGSLRRRREHVHTAGATGSCTVTDHLELDRDDARSQRDDDVSVSAESSLTRATGDAHAGDSADAQKMWVNAAIVIAPNATNEVGQPHTFTVTVLQDTGSGSRAGRRRPAVQRDLDDGERCERRCRRVRST